MGLFRKSDPKAQQAGAIADFWQWWSQARGEITASISNGKAEQQARAISPRVAAIHRDLSWELTKGTAASHGLVVTAAGDPKLRAAAYRWLAAAPPADGTWEYHAARPASPAVFSSKLGIGGAMLDMEQMVYAVTVEKDRRCVNVVCHHPEFVNLPDEVQGQVSFLSLDWLLGEEQVEIWLGTIEWSAAALFAPRTPSDLRYAVDAITADDSWAVMSAQGRDGLPHMALVSQPLRSARWPRFDQHVAVTLPYQRLTEVGLPADESLQALRALEDSLTEAAGADAALVAHETVKGRRTLHFYADSHSDAADRIKALAPRWAEGQAGVDVGHDPGLERVQHLR
ncbi:DUF695 domain-containing protein [Rhizocola hellebori]|nr:DUF695 domain-containing protein [Rhizocola hellebori]